MKFQTKPFLLLTILILILYVQANEKIAPTPLNYAIDPYGLLHLIPNSNGSVTRIKDFYPTVPPNAFSKDVLLNPDKKTWVRIYLPKKPKPSKLPIIIYAYGGGFIILSTSTPSFDSFLSNASSQLDVLIVSVEYRLAPEHRLPAAYDDVLEALYWVKKKNDAWIKNYGDITKCILMGESAGGNIVYNVALLASNVERELDPLVIKGLVMIQPFFGGVRRTRSELRLGNEKGDLPLVVTDFMWNLSLPIGANRNHVYCNPIIRNGSRELTKIKELGWRVVITGCDGDLLFDKQVQVFRYLKKRGINVVGKFSKGDNHGVFVTEPSKAIKLFTFVRRSFSF